MNTIIIDLRKARLPDSTRKRRVLFVPPPAGNISIIASPGTFTLTGDAASVLHARVVSGSPATFVLTGAAATLATAVSAAPGTFVLTGAAASVLRDRLANGSAGAFVLNGAAATLTTSGNIVLVGSPGTLALTGGAASVLHGRLVSASAGAFSLGGAAASVLYGRLTTGSPGTFVLSGDAATLFFTPVGPQSPFYSMLTQIKQIVDGLGLVDWNNVALPSVVRKLPKVDEEIDVLPLLCIVPLDRPPQHHPITFGVSYNTVYPCELAFIAPGNRDFTSHLDTYMAWNFAVSQAFKLPAGLKALVPSVWDVNVRLGLVIDRNEVNNNYDYGGLTIEVSALE